MSVVFFGFTGIAQAVRPVVRPAVRPAVRPIVMPYKKPHKVFLDEPFVEFSVKPDRIDLGMVPTTGRGSSRAELEAHIVANYPYQIKASFTPFKQERGHYSIKPKHISAKLNGKNVLIGGTAVPIIRSEKATPDGGLSFPVDVKLSLSNAVMYPAGPYKGTLIFTITTVAF